MRRRVGRCSTRELLLPCGVFVSQMACVPLTVASTRLLKVLNNPQHSLQSTAIWVLVSCVWLMTGRILVSYGMMYREALREDLIRRGRVWTIVDPNAAPGMARTAAAIQQSAQESVDLMTDDEVSAMVRDRQ